MAYGSADIESARVLQDLRNRFVAFDNIVRNALLGLDAEVKQTDLWLRGEQLAACKMGLRKAEEAVARAQAELMDAKMRATFDVKTSCVDEARALQRAKERKVDAERRLERLKQWTHALDQKAGKMMVPCTTLGVLLDRLTPNALARLDKMVENLDAYFRPEEPA